MNREHLIELAELLTEAMLKAEDGDPFIYMCIQEDLRRAYLLLEEEEDCEQIRKFMEGLK